MPAKKKSSRGRLNSRNQIDRGPMVRVIIWCFVVCTLVVGLIMSTYGLERLFFSKNPHFTLREIEIRVEKGNLDEQDIKTRLGLIPREQNIYGLNLGELRSKLYNDAIIEEASVTRILPDTIQVTVAGRTPIAQLLSKGGKTVDASGYVMPKGKTEAVLNLPVILGVKGVKQAEYGTRLDDKMLLCALDFLRLKAVVNGGNMLDVTSVVCNRQYDELIIMLDGVPRYYIKDGARLVLPTENMPNALARARDALEVRALAGQWSGRINSTYRRVYVTP